MGDGTSFAIVTPPQKGVIVRDKENFPRIPKKLLRLSPEKLQKMIDKIGKSIEFNRNAWLPNLETINKLIMTRVVLECTKTAVERQIEARRGKEY